MYEWTNRYKNWPGRLLWAVFISSCRHHCSHCHHCRGNPWKEICQVAYLILFNFTDSNGKKGQAITSIHEGKCSITRLVKLSYLSSGSFASLLTSKPVMFKCFCAVVTLSAPGNRGSVISFWTVLITQLQVQSSDKYNFIIIPHEVYHKVYLQETPALN